MATGPLVGLRILDISTVIAGPWAATLLADLGADVLKVEIPGRGDPLRALAPHKDGVPLWWKVTNRNKKGITLDLRKAAGQTLLKRLLPHFEVLVENFRPGTLDRWGLDRSALLEANPKLTILRVTGFGQTGPYRSRPGFARVFESMSGFTHLCGEQDGPPQHCGFPISDAVGGLFGALGIVSALYHRRTDPEAPGEDIDLSVTESMFRVLDFLAIEYDQLGIVRGRSGNQSQYGAPGDFYRTRDGHWAPIVASTQSIFERMAKALGMPELIADPRFATNADRLRNRDALDAALSKGIATLDMEELKQVLDENQVGFSPVYTIKDIFADPHFTAREAITAVEDDDFGAVRMQNVVPRFARAPAQIRHTGPGLGQHNGEIYGGLLGLSEQEQKELEAAGVI